MLSDGVPSGIAVFDDFPVHVVLRGEGGPFSNSLAISLDAIVESTASC